MMKMGFLTRFAEAEDVQKLLYMMRSLSEFEGYSKDFRVTETDLLERGFTCKSPQFRAIVAETTNKELLGYAVVYQVDFTHNLLPTLHLKELFVEKSARQLGVGQALMQAVIDYAKSQQAGCLKWDVLPNNELAKQFYRNFTAHPVENWEAWILNFLDLSDIPSKNKNPSHF
jgi:ribosomal protein S18 acetylase RimI-like enzyme